MQERVTAIGGTHCKSTPALDWELSFPYEFPWRINMPIRIVLADDHVLVRQGLKSLLERERFQVVAEASDGQEAVRLTETHHPDIAVFDISMPTLNGIDAVREWSFLPKDESNSAYAA